MHKLWRNLFKDFDIFDNKNKYITDKNGNKLHIYFNMAVHPNNCNYIENLSNKKIQKMEIFSIY